MKHRAAVFLYGLARSNRKTWNSILTNLVYSNCIDLYAHIWKLPSSSANNHGFASESLKTTSRLVSELLYCPHLVNISIQQQITHTPFILCDSNGVQYNHSNQLNCSLSIRSSLALADCQYDWYILTRSDIRFRTALKLDFLDPSCGFYYSGFLNSSSGQHECEDLIMICHKRYLNVFELFHHYLATLRFHDHAIYNRIFYVLDELSIPRQQLPFKQNHDYLLHRTLASRINRKLSIQV